ncbi:MAG: DUF4410 domain-containing protein [Methylophilaceae bacterium]
MPKLTNLLRITLFSAFILLAPGIAVADQKPAVGSYEDWDDLDKVEIKQLFKLSDYATVTVEPFDTKDVELPEQDDNTYKPVVEAQSLFNQRIFAKIQDELDQKPVLANVDVSKGNGLIVRGKVIEMNPGIKSLRMFVGYGAGHAGIVMNCELIDIKTNTVLATMTQKRASSNGDYDEALEELTEELGEDIASLIAHFQ